MSIFFCLCTSHACSLSPWKCMLRKQHHLVNGNGIQHIHSEYIIEMLLLPKYKKYLKPKKYSCCLFLRREKFLLNKYAERASKMTEKTRHSAGCAVMFIILYDHWCCKATLRNLQFWFIKQYELSCACVMRITAIIMQCFLKFNRKILPLSIVIDIEKEEIKKKTWKTAFFFNSLRFIFIFIFFV